MGDGHKHWPSWGEVEGERGKEEKEKERGRGGEGRGREGRERGEGRRGGRMKTIIVSQASTNTYTTRHDKEAGARHGVNYLIKH